MARSKKSKKSTTKSDVAKDTVLSDQEASATDTVEELLEDKPQDDVAVPDASDDVVDAPTPEDSADADAAQNDDVDAADEAPLKDADLDAALSDDAASNDAEDGEAAALDSGEAVSEASEDVAEQTDETSLPEADAITQVSAPAPEANPSKSIFMPLLAGGALCLVLGYAASNFVKPSGWPFPGSDTSELETRLASLETDLVAANAREAELTALVGTLRTDIATDVDEKLSNVDVQAQLAPLQETVDGMSTRLRAVEAAPVAEAIVSPEATAAYEAQLADMQTLLTSQIARLEEAKLAAENEEADAARASASARLQEALSTGQPFANILNGIEIDVPPAIAQHAQTGVATLPTLATEFSLAADLAIVATAKIPNDNQSVFDKLLRTQLGLRSLTPQEGTSADAILSRAEQAIRDVDLGVALTEISTLPDVGQGVMADWAARAQARLDVTTALSSMLDK